MHAIQNGKFEISKTERQEGGEGDIHSAWKKRRKERNLQFSIDPIRPNVRPKPKDYLLTIINYEDKN